MDPTIIQEFKEHATKGINAGENNYHTIYRFSNNSGASVIFGPGSYGLEAVRIYFNEDGYYLAGEPKPYLNKEELTKFLKNIKENGQ